MSMQTVIFLQLFWLAVIGSIVYIAFKKVRVMTQVNGG